MNLLSERHIVIDFSKYNSSDELISAIPSPELEMSIVIPCYSEPGILETLASLEAIKTSHTCEVIILINYSLDDESEVKSYNNKTYEELIQAINSGKLKRHVYCPVLVKNIVPKWAGVGMARRIGMDEALYRFRRLDRDGIIVCLDADCTVETNYLDSIISFFENNPSFDAASIHFEHSIEEGHAIIDYELHLRYHIEFQRWLGLPFAHQTVGSSMAVRTSAYAAHGGMNKRKAGEDFYFLHKFASIGKLGVINETTVYPSSRASHRVPFGTGKAVGAIQAGKEQRTYNPASYLALVPLISAIEKLWLGQTETTIDSLQENAKEFFIQNRALNVIPEIRANTRSYDAFEKRFFRWFNAFLLMKYLHFMRDHVYENLKVGEASFELSNLLEINNAGWNNREYLEWLRLRSKSWQP